MNKGYLQYEVENWMDKYSYPFRNQEDLIESRTSYEQLKEAAENAYLLLDKIQDSIDDLFNEDY